LSAPVLFDDRYTKLSDFAGLVDEQIAAALVAGELVLEDEGIPQGPIVALNIVGTAIAGTVAAGIGTITLSTGSGSGLDADTLDGIDSTGFELLSRKAAASGYASLDAGTLVVQNPTNATATPTASKIPIADGSGKLAAGWGGSASTLATLNSSTKVVQDPASATGTPTASSIPISGAGGRLAAGWGGAASSLATLDASTRLVEAAQNLYETGGGTLAAGAVTALDFIRRVGNTYTSARAPRVLFSGRVNATATGSGDQTLLTQVITGGDIGTAKIVMLECSVRKTTGSSAQTFKLKYGPTPTTIATGGSDTTVQNKIRFLLWADGATNAQRGSIEGTNKIGYAIGTGAVDSTSDQNLLITVANATTTDVVTIDEARILIFD